MDNMLSTLFVLRYYRWKYKDREDKPLFVYAGSPESGTGAVENFGYPIPTDEACPLVVSDPLNTRWSYAGSKGLGEQATICSGLPWIVFRPNNIYGPRQKNHFVPEFIERAVAGDYNLYGWDNTRSWLYIDDCVDALVKLIHTGEARGEIVNIGSNEEKQVITLAEIILKHLGIDENFIIKNEAPLGSANRRMPDISKLKKLTGWQPTTNLYDGLKLTVEYEKDNILR
jgi:UDP-glucose 4-epimerase